MLVQASSDDDSSDGIEYTRTWVDARKPATGDAQWRCLSQALYFEARGESVRGQFAVAEVIMNRVRSRRYPDSICSVVRQGTGKKFACQFTYTCDGQRETISNHSAFQREGKVAALVLDKSPRDLTDGATHYHTTAVRPSWADAFQLTTTIGRHRFYRDPRRLSQN